MMGSGMASHEWRGPHLVHERAERAEAKLDEIEGFVKQRLGYYENTEDAHVVTELRLLLVKVHDLKNS